MPPKDGGPGQALGHLSSWRATAQAPRAEADTHRLFLCPLRWVCIVGALLSPGQSQHATPISGNTLYTAKGHV